MSVILMNMLRTIKVKVDCPKALGLETLRTAKEIFDLHVEIAFRDRTWNKLKLHRACYREVRNRYPKFQSSLVQTVRDTASEAIKATKFRRFPEKRKSSGLRYNLRTFSLSGRRVSFSLLGGRCKCEVKVPKHHLTVWQNGKVQAATLNYDRKTFWLHVTFVLPDVKPIARGKTLGVDRGLMNLAVCSDGRFFTSKAIRAAQRRFLYNKRGLQSKRHSRSARKKLKDMRRREQRFQSEANHVVTKTIAATPGVKTFALEDLSKIRVRSGRKGRNWNHRFNRWSFSQFERFLRYKAEDQGKQVVLVDARFSSRTCHRCHAGGQRQGGRFFCPACSLRTHADLNAALVIRDRHVSSLSAPPVRRHGAAGRPVSRPNARRDETKTGFQDPGLRWSAKSKPWDLSQGS